MVERGASPLSAWRHTLRSVNSGYYSVTTTATAINTDANEVPGMTGGIVIVKVPPGGQTVYIGGSDVTADTTAGTAGFPIVAGDSMSVPYSPGESVYARVAATTQNVNVFRQGV